MHPLGCLYYLYQWCTVKKISNSRNLTQFWHWHAAGSLRIALLPTQEVLCEMCSAFTVAESFISQSSWRIYDCAKLISVRFKALCWLTVLLLEKLNNFCKWSTWHIIVLFYNTFITVLYMFRATSCSSSGGQILLIQNLV